MGVPVRDTVHFLLPFLIVAAVVAVGLLAYFELVGQLIETMP